jgi:hypothetical protein
MAVLSNRRRSQADDELWQAHYLETRRQTTQIQQQIKQGIGTTK